MAGERHGNSMGMLCVNPPLWDQLLNQLADFDEVWKRRSATAGYPKTSSF
jgi:hypothetical protein